MEEDNQKNAVENMAENLAENAKNSTINKTKKAAKFAVKKVMAAIGHALISLITTLLPYIAIIVAVVVLIDGFSYVLELITGDDTTKAVYTALGIDNDSLNNVGDIADIIEIKADSQGYHLEFNVDLDEKLDNVINELNKQNTSINLENKDSLKKFIIAEAMTKYPNLGGESDGVTKFQGTITLKRITPNKQIGEVTEADYEEINLTYIDKSTFDQYIQNNNQQVLNYFTFDENKNIITATWSWANDGTSNVLQLNESSPINYRDAISNYTMPFEYPLFFLIDGGSEEFCVELANLAMKSRIEIAIIDTVENSTTKTTVTKNITESTDIYTIKENGVEEKVEAAVIPDRELTPVSEETITTTESVSQTIEISSIDSWALKKNRANIQNNNKYTPLREISRSTSPEPEKEVESEINGNTKTVKTKTIFTTTVLEEESSKNSYSYGDSKVEENYEDFVEIYAKYKATLNNNLLPDWLFELMENNKKTSNMVNLTKLLLYHATNVDYGVTSLDDLDFSFSFNMIDANLRTQGNVQLAYDYIAQWENLDMYKYLRTNDYDDKYDTDRFLNEYITKDKKYFICATDIDANNGTRNFGFGVLHYVNGNWGNIQEYASEGITINQEQYKVLGTLIPVDVQERVALKVVERNRNLVIQHANNIGVDLNDNQINALTYAAHKYGPYDAGAGIKDIPMALELYKKYGDTEEFKNNCFIFTDNRSEWSNALWNVFHNGIYRNSLGETIDTSKYNQLDSALIAESGQGYDNIYQSSSGNKYKLFIQKRYPDVPYWPESNSKTVAGAGCGPTSAAIILSGFGTNDTPKTVALSYDAKGIPYNECKFFTDRGFRATCESVDWDKAIKHLKSGNPMVVNIVSGIKLNDAYYDSHYITFLDIDEAGDNIYIGDTGGWGGSGNGWQKISYLKKCAAFGNFIYVYKN